MLLQRTVALEEGLLELAAVAGSLDAAVAFVVAKDAGTDGYVIVLHCLVQADSAAWIADVLAMLAAFARVELGAFCLGAAATDAHRPGAHPAGAGPAAAAGPASAGLDPAAGRGAPGRAGPWTAFVRRRVGIAPAADGGARALSGLGCPPGT
ncbi:hypothetical protein CG747_39555 [Streptomyces sp. CB02959]|uniref:hypothetical protein n=1 Tax=Streptomyces sp. CB02959 TaxID=2020330 RepID=UPI000C2721A3|nr:hypothetical protein [Streptomyces sp. CB02959]PJN34450.1 hypothetical protein CG747_39555 [Streptomyces sp. CB02959]